MRFMLAAVQFQCTPLMHSDCALMQKHDGCWWFGQPGECRSWDVLIATFIVAAGTDYVMVMALVVCGNEKSNKSTRMLRYHSP